VVATDPGLVREYHAALIDTFKDHAASRVAAENPGDRAPDRR
jgi:hypothetical protein